jgi:hypothetical protein
MDNKKKPENISVDVGTIDKLKEQLSSYYNGTHYVNTNISDVNTNRRIPTTPGAYVSPTTHTITSPNSTPFFGAGGSGTNWGNPLESELDLTGEIEEFVWKVTCVRLFTSPEKSTNLTVLLERGWEPFSVQNDGTGNMLMYLRKMVEL